MRRITSLLVAGLLSLAFSLPAFAGQFQDWETSTHTDSMTDDKLTFIGTMSQTTGDGEGFLFAKCEGAASDDFYIGVLTARFLNTDYDSVKVMLRVDKDDPLTMRWEADDQTAYLFDSASSRALLRQMKQGTTATVRVYSFDYDQYDYQFSLMGLTAASQHLHCLE